jgi:hypothetical protein
LAVVAVLQTMIVQIIQQEAQILDFRLVLEVEHLAVEALPVVAHMDTVEVVGVMERLGKEMMVG